MSQDTTQPLSRRLAWWLRRIAGPTIPELQAQLALEKRESDALRVRLHREVTEHNRSLQRVNDLEAKVSVLLDDCMPEELDPTSPLAVQEYMGHVEEISLPEFGRPKEGTTRFMQRLLEIAQNPSMLPRTPEAMAMPPAIIGNLDSDRFSPWWDTQGCRLESITQREFARQVWDAAMARMQTGSKPEMLEGVL